MGEKSELEQKLDEALKIVARMRERAEQAEVDAVRLAEIKQNSLLGPVVDDLLQQADVASLVKVIRTEDVDEEDVVTEDENGGVIDRVYGRMLKYKVLSVFEKNPKKVFKAAEIASLTKEPITSIRAQLTKFYKTGVLSRPRHGGYQIASPDSSKKKQTRSQT